MNNERKFSYEEVCDMYREGIFGFNKLVQYLPDDKLPYHVEQLIEIAYNTPVDSDLAMLSADFVEKVGDRFYTLPEVIQHELIENMKPLIYTGKTDFLINLSESVIADLISVLDSSEAKASKSYFSYTTLRSLASKFNSPLVVNLCLEKAVEIATPQVLSGIIRDAVTNNVEIDYERLYQLIHENLKYEKQCARLIEDYEGLRQARDEYEKKISNIDDRDIFDIDDDSKWLEELRKGKKELDVESDFKNLTSELDLEDIDADVLFDSEEGAINQDGVIANEEVRRHR